MADPARIPVSAYMITRDNARTVETALRSVAAWADEIVLVDSFSTDQTLEIARRYGAKIEQRPWPGFSDQYQYASERCRNDWVLFLDADEELAPDLIREIQEELPRNAARPEAEQVRGYYGHRRTWYLGRWILHGGWVPDYEIRLYRRQYGEWKGGLHAKVHIDGRVAHFRGLYHHYTYADIADQLRTIDRYSTTDAADMQAAGVRASCCRMTGRALFRFVRDYVLKRGFLDGMPGFIIAVNTAFYVFVKNAKLWEAQNLRPKEGKPQ